MSEDEREAADLLIGAAVWYPREFGVMAEFPWVEDNTITAAETEALYGFRWTPRYSSDHAQPLLQMAWAQQEITEQEGEAIKFLYRTTRYAPELATTLFGKTWVQDGITTDDLTVIKHLHRMARPEEMDELVWLNAPSEAEYHQMALELSLQILDAAWLQDGPDRHEAKAIQRLSWMFGRTPELAAKAWQKPWLSDDITRDEVVVLENIDWLARPKDDKFEQQTLAAALQILDMPFLETVTVADAPAVRSLRRLEGNDTAAFLEIMTHPRLKDGITGEEAKIVALLGGTYQNRPESVEVLLRGTGVHLEERTIELPLAGETLLAVIRIRDHVTPNIDYLEHSVRTIEEFMGEPFPTGYVALYFDDANVRSGGGAGTNFGTHIAMSLDYDVENGRLWDYAPSTIAHEVAHHYWRGNSRDWLDEGPANFLESIAENARIDKPIEVRSNPCAAADTIAELESLAVHRETWQETVAQNWFRCNYSLGERLFVELYETLGEETFRQGFRSLWLKSQAEDYNDDCEGTDLTICHVAAAFKTSESDAIAAKIDEVLDRWYGPRE